MSYQEKVVGNQIIYVFGLGMLLVYLCLAGQYESWIAPLSVILAVPLSLIGPVDRADQPGLANNLYTQIGLVLLIALSAKNAILIVEVARERRMLHGEPILEAAVDAARTRFRPILMTSFAFILGVVPLVTATGAGANARVSLGLSVFSGMIASTCLAVLFVPSFFVVLQRFEEWRRPIKRPPQRRAGRCSAAASRAVSLAPQVRRNAHAEHDRTRWRSSRGRARSDRVGATARRPRRCWRGRAPQCSWSTSTRRRSSETRQIIEGEGGTCAVHRCDMLVAAEVQEMVQACLDRFKRIDILVNNVGGSAPGDPVSMSEEVWDRQIDMNLKTAFLGCKYVLPVMEAQGKGAIVNMSSVAGTAQRWSWRARACRLQREQGGR